MTYGFDAYNQCVYPELAQTIRLNLGGDNTAKVLIVDDSNRSRHLQPDDNGSGGQNCDVFGGGLNEHIPVVIVDELPTVDIGKQSESRNDNK